MKTVDEARAMLKDEIRYKINVAKPLEEAKELSSYVMTKLITDYVDDFNEETKEVRNNKDKYTMSHIVEQIDNAKTSVHKKYDDMVKEMDTKHRELVQQSLDYLDERMTDFEVNEGLNINVEQAGILENQIKSELSSINGSASHVIEKTTESMKNLIRRAKHSREYGRTALTFMHLYDNKFKSVENEMEDVNGNYTAYNMLKEELYQASYPEQYLAYKVMKDHISHHILKGVIPVSLEMAQQSIKGKSDKFKKDVGEEKNRERRRNHIMP